MRVQSMRAMAPLRKRVLMRAEGARSDPKKTGRLGLWPTTRTLSYFSRLRMRSWNFWTLASGERAGGDVDFCVVAGLVADQRRGLQRAFERAGNDAVELHIQRAEKAADEEGLLLAFLIEGALDVNQGIGTARAGAGVAEDVKVHNRFIEMTIQLRFQELLTGL